MIDKNCIVCKSTDSEYYEEFDEYYCEDCQPTCVYCGETIYECLCNSDNTERFE